MFDYSTGGNAYLNGGVPVSHSVQFAFSDDGSVAIDGLLGTRNVYNTIAGRYQDGSIKFPTPQKELTTLQPYVSLGSTDEAEILLCALDPYGLGYVDLKNTLELSFSDDYRTVVPSSGIGAAQAYLASPNFYLIGGYDIALYDAILFKKEQGVSFNYDVRDLDIKNSYPGMPIKSTFRIFNTGEERSEYVIGSSERCFTIDNPAGVLAPGEYVDVAVTFLADTPGEYSSQLTITNEEDDFTFSIAAVCVDMPDFSQIVKEGELKFSTDPRFPWTISDKYGSEPVAVCGNSGKEQTTSPLVVEVTVSDRHAGNLTYEGYCDPYHPTRDAFGVIIDGEESYVSPSGGGPTSASIEIAPGTHTIEFVYVKGPRVEGNFATGGDYAWIKNISLSEDPLEEKAFTVSSQRVVFSPRSILKDGANDETVVYIRNEGWADLTIIGSESDSEAFSAEFDSEPVGTFGYAAVKLRFHTFTPGAQSGDVTIRTSAGDVVISCNAQAVSVPDFSPIVTNGEFDFDTTIAYPFKVDGNKAYNSTSKKADRKATNSMLQAMFDVPEGYYGELSWRARVSTTGADGDDATDYATIYIDGDDTAIDYNGETVATQFDFSPATVNFYPGSHFVCFSYTQVGDNSYAGDDRIEVSDLSLSLRQMKENDVRFWGESSAAFDNVRISKVYQREVKLTNFGTRTLQIKSAVFDGPFTAEIDPERFYNTFEEIPIAITFIPKQAGNFTGAIILNTSAGEVRIECSASVVDDPTTLLIEDFEDDWRLWDLIDGDGDGMTWANVMVPQNAFHGERALQSFSIHSDFTEDEPIDDIALSPAFTVPADGAKLSFYLACYYPAAADRLTVWAGTGDDYENYKLIGDFDLQNVASYYNRYECMLDELAGQTVRLAFRHQLDKGVMSFVAIDDILVSTDKSGMPGANVQETKAVEYYNLQGIRVANPAHGVYVKRTVYADGSVAVEKINLK